MIIETAIIKIGNFKGLRLSKTILEKCNIKDKIEIILERERIILKELEAPRQNWEKAFEKMRKENDDKMLVNDVFDDENSEELNYSKILLL